MSYWRDRKVLVTGGSGFVGRHLVEALAAAGARVTCTHFRRVRDDLPPRVTSVSADLRSLDDCLTALTGAPDTVFHCAAATAGAAVMAGDPLSLVTPNALMAASLLEACHRSGVRKFIYLSSGTVYPWPDGGRPRTEAEGHLGDPHPSHFGVSWTKRYGEKLCEFYSRHLPSPRTSCVVARLSNVYGPHDKFDQSRSHALAATVRKVAERQDPLVVWGDGSEVRDFLHVDDCVRGLLLAAEKTEGFDVFNLASGESCSVGMLVTLLAGIEGYSPLITHDAARPTTVPRRLLSTEKSERLLGFRTRTKLQDGLAATLRWYKEHHRGEK